MFVNIIKVNVIILLYLTFLYLNATLFFWSRYLCKISCLVTTDHISCFVLSMSTSCLFQLVYVIISMFIGNPLTNIQVLLIVF